MLAALNLRTLIPSRLVRQWFCAEDDKGVIWPVVRLIIIHHWFVSFDVLKVTLYP